MLKLIPHVQMPTVDKLTPHFVKARYFTTFDAKNGFWQLKLDKTSSLLTTFWGPDKRYFWLRVPFGISPAPEIFMNHMKQAVKELSGVIAMIDDVIVYG